MSNFYVAPDAVGDGTLGNPGSLLTAHAHTGWAAAIAAGDTVYLRAGTYNNGTTIGLITFSGSAGNLVTWRSYPGELAILNFPVYFGNKDYHRFQDLEIIDTNKAIRAIAIGYFDSTVLNHHHEWINCIIHDVPGVWTGGAGGNSVRGCVMWNIGKDRKDHVCYPHVVDFSGNIVGWCSGDVISLGTPGTVAKDNILFGSGITINSAEVTLALTLATAADVTSQSAINNCIFETQAAFKGLLMQGADHGTITGNTISAPYPLKLAAPFVTGIVTGNTLYASYVGVYNEVDRNDASGTWTWDANAYYDVNDSVRFFEVGAALTFEQWKVTNPTYDADSVSFNATAPPDSVKVFPNADEAKRGHVAIFNFTGAATAAVQLSAVLSPGDTYQVYSAQHFNSGPILTGTYTGAAINFPLIGLSVAPLLYITGLVQPVATSPTFAAFVVIGAAAAVPPDPEPEPEPEPELPLPRPGQRVCWSFNLRSIVPCS